MKVKLTQEESLRQEEGQRLAELCQTEGWRKVLYPLLEAGIRSAIVDPRKFKTDEEYLYAQKIAWANGHAYSELLDIIDNKVSDSTFLTEKEQGKHIDKLAESMS